MCFGRSPLLLARWAEFSAFADTIFRSHVGNMPNVSAQIYDNEVNAGQFAFSARVHQALGEYRLELFDESASRGWPLVRHTAMQFPAVLQEQISTSQFCLGSDVVVAPVMSPDATTVSVFLPNIDDGPWMFVAGAGQVAVSADACVRNKTASGSWCTVPVRQPGAGTVAPFFFRNQTKSTGVLNFVKWLLAEPQAS